MCVCACVRVFALRRPPAQPRSAAACMIEAPPIPRSAKPRLRTSHEVGDRRVGALPSFHRAPPALPAPAAARSGWPLGSPTTAAVPRRPEPPPPVRALARLLDAVPAVFPPAARVAPLLRQPRPRHRRRRGLRHALRHLRLSRAPAHLRWPSRRRGAGRMPGASRPLHSAGWPVVGIPSYPALPAADAGRRGVLRFLGCRRLQGTTTRRAPRPSPTSPRSPPATRSTLVCTHRLPLRRAEDGAPDVLLARASGPSASWRPA